MLRRAARARSGACKRKAGGSAPSNPRCRARSLPPQSATSVIANSTRLSCIQRLSPEAAGVQTPLSASQPSDAHAARVCFALGSPRHFAMQSVKDSAVVVSFQVRHLSHRATPCLSALLPLRKAVGAVGSYAQGLSCLAESRRGGVRHPLLPARGKARATAVCGSSGSRFSAGSQMPRRRIGLTARCQARQRLLVSSVILPLLPVLSGVVGHTLLDSLRP